MAMDSCPRRQEPNACKNCIVELGDRIFKRRILGGPIEASPTWCEEAIQMGNFIDKAVNRNQELYEILKYVASCPAEVIDGEQAVFIPRALMERLIKAVGT